jgi:hypothetical protein
MPIFDSPSDVRVALGLMRKANPLIKVVYFGPKPFLDNKTITFPSIIRGHISIVDINDYLIKRYN